MLRLTKLFILIFSCTMLSMNQPPQENITNIKRLPTASANSFYTSNKAPLKPLQLIKLPVGSIQPQGWILKYLQLQRDGLTGRLGEISAWLDINNIFNNKYQRWYGYEVYGTGVLAGVILKF